MPHAHLTEFVRQTVHEHFASLGANPAEAVVESVLVRQGYYCGRRFVQDRWEAVWFIEEKQIKFYDERGRAVKSMAVEPGGLIRMAAA